MDFLRSIMFPALLAGVLTGLFSSVIHLATTVPLIERAEVFEHETSSAVNHVGAMVSQDHSHAPPSTGPDYQRGALTIMAMVLAYVGFALVVAAAGTIAGGLENWRSGFLWGIAGFAAFTLAPGLGLPPELPAMPAAELSSRQLWWIATVAGTLSAMGLAFHYRNWVGFVVGAALVLAPHLIGAPQPVDEMSPIPADLHSQFVKMTFLASLASWALMGVLLGWLRMRVRPRRPQTTPGYS